MRLLVCLLALLLLAFSAPVAANEVDNLRTFARGAGLPDAVAIEIQAADADASNANAYYWKGGVVCMWIFCTDVPEHIVLRLPEQWPLEWKLSVLAHEIAHYHQWRTQLAGYLDPQTLEWDADVMGARLMCRAGYLNGPELAARSLTAMTTDPWHLGGHGYHYARIANVRARDCSGSLRSEES